MTAITKEQIRRVYALGAAIGAVERGNKDDNLHALVYSITQKSSVSALTRDEFYVVERELLTRMQYKNRTEPLKNRKKERDNTAPGMITEAQRGLAWRYIYRLQELDTKITGATAGERMCGAIKKILGVEAQVKDPFRWITAEQAPTLIEQLKRYVRTAERQAKKAGVG